MRETGVYYDGRTAYVRFVSPSSVEVRSMPKASYRKCKGMPPGVLYKRSRPTFDDEPWEEEKPIKCY